MFWYWFILERLLWKSFPIYLFGFCFVTFWYFFYFVKFVCSEILALRFWKSLLFLTHSSWAFSGVFCMCLAVIWISFWLIFITGVCSKIPCSIVSCLKTPVLWIYYKSTDWLPHDVGYECQESRNRIVTVLYPFFFCLLVLYFYIAPSRVFFQYVSC